MASGSPGDDHEHSSLRTEHVAEPCVDDAAVQFQLVGNPGVSGFDVDDAIGVPNGFTQPGHGSADREVPCRLHLAFAMGLGGNQLHD